MTCLIVFSAGFALGIYAIYLAFASGLHVDVLVIGVMLIICSGFGTFDCLKDLIINRKKHLGE